MKKLEKLLDFETMSHPTAGAVAPSHAIMRRKGGSGLPCLVLSAGREREDEPEEDMSCRHGRTCQSIHLGPTWAPAAEKDTEKGLHLVESS